MKKKWLYYTLSLGCLSAFIFSGNLLNSNTTESLTQVYAKQAKQVDIGREKDTITTITIEEEHLITEKIANISQKYSEVDIHMYANKDTKAYLKDDGKDVLEEIPYGSYIHIIGANEYDEKTYYKIEIDGEIGYLKSMHVTNEKLFMKQNKKVYAYKDTNIYKDTKKKKTNGKVDSLHGIDVIGKNNELSLYKVKMENEDVGYIPFEKVSSEMLFSKESCSRYAKKDINLVKTPAKDAKVTKKLNIHEKVSVIGFSENWAKIKLQDGTICYTEKTNLTKTAPPVVQPVVASTNNQTTQNSTPVTVGPTSQAARKAVEHAYGMIGTPYVYGAASRKATDCSGFTMQCYAAAGVVIPRTAATQNNAGTKVSLSSAKPGDLITWSAGSGVSHVGIYVGDGYMIHASCSKGVTKTNVYQYQKYQTLVSVVRIAP